MKPLFLSIGLAVFASAAMAEAPATSTAPASQPATTKAVTSEGVGHGEPGVPAPVGFSGQGRITSRVIVYIIDHSESGKEIFDSAKKEIKKSVSNFPQPHSFAMIVIGEKVDGTFPKEAGTIAKVSAEVKKEAVAFIDALKPEGNNDGVLDPFVEAFKQAFAMKPDIIYFIAEGNVDPKLAGKVKEMNKDYAKVNTIVFLKPMGETKKTLQEIAAESNGGRFKLVTESDLGK